MLRPNGIVTIQAPTPNATVTIAAFAPITSPNATPPTSRTDAVTTVANSSGSAPASKIARANAVTPRRFDASARCSANRSAPHTIAAVPATIAISHKTLDTDQCVTELVRSDAPHG